MALPKMRVRETRCGWNATTSRPVAGHGAAGLEVAGDLDGMVGVAVVDAHARRLALGLHPAPGPR